MFNKDNNPYPSESNSYEDSRSQKDQAMNNSFSNHTDSKNFSQLTTEIMPPEMMFPYRSHSLSPLRRKIDDILSKVIATIIGLSILALFGCFVFGLVGATYRTLSGKPNEDDVNYALDLYLRGTEHYASIVDEENYHPEDYLKKEGEDFYKGTIHRYSLAVDSPAASVDYYILPRAYAETYQDVTTTSSRLRSPSLNKDDASYTGAKNAIKFLKDVDYDDLVILINRESTKSYGRSASIIIDVCPSLIRYSVCTEKKDIDNYFDTYIDIPKSAYIGN